MAVGQRDISGLTAVRYYNGEGVSETAGSIVFLGIRRAFDKRRRTVPFCDAFSPEGTQLLSQSSLGEMQKKQPAQFGETSSSSDEFWFGLDMAEIPDYENKGIHVLGKSGGTGIIRLWCIRC